MFHIISVPTDFYNDIVSGEVKTIREKKNRPYTTDCVIVAQEKGENGLPTGREAVLDVKAVTPGGGKTGIAASHVEIKFAFHREGQNPLPDWYVKRIATHVVATEETAEVNTNAPAFAAP